MANSTKKIELSVIVPAFNEEGNLRELYKRLLESLSSIGLQWEIIIADDGSSDGTWQKIVELNSRDNRVKGIRFSRNFGHQYALFAGLSKSQGNIIVSMDADLEHPPEIIAKLVEEWRKGYKIVHTVRCDTATDSFIKKLTSGLFYKIFSYLSGVNMKSGMADFRLLDKQVADDILKFREEGLFLRGIVHWVGYSSSRVDYTCGKRFSGRSKYTWAKMLKFMYAGITSFSIVPLRIGVVIGILTSIIAFSELVYAFYAKVFLNTTVPGWTSAVSIVSFLFGILFILIGLLGEYIGKILIQVKDRPRYLISEEV